MLTVEQVKKLDEKVHKALELIDTLKKENSKLRNELGGYEYKIKQLETTLGGFKDEQSEIENGINDMLEKLDILEDKISEPSTFDQEQNQPVPSSEGSPNVNNFSEHPEETHKEVNDSSDENRPETPRVEMDYESRYNESNIEEKQEENNENTSSTSPELEIF